MMFDKWVEEFKGREIVIWGASIGGNQAFHCLHKNGIEITAYCDNSMQKQGTLYNGKPVVSPGSLREQFADGRSFVVIIASYAYETIFAQVKTLNLNCSVYIYLLYDPCHLKEGILYTDREKNEIRALYSSEIYTQQLLELILEKGLLNRNSFGKIEEYAGFGGIEAYFYDDIANQVLEQELTLLDAGCYIGDSISQIENVFQKQVKKIYGFEPNHENCEKIEKRCFDHFTLYRVGLGNRNGYEYFSETGPFFRASGEQSGISVPVARLDDMELNIHGKCILKIDIEGSEMACLEGAEQFISEYRPYIAVCVYHREKDILEIPQFIKNIAGNYQFFLRGGMHTVCYAIPKGGISE